MRYNVGQALMWIIVIIGAIFAYATQEKICDYGQRNVTWFILTAFLTIMAIIISVNYNNNRSEL
jgi:uncharacterized membrane protein